jgi:hypothetical protein
MCGIKIHPYQGVADLQGAMHTFVLSVRNLLDIDIIIGSVATSIILCPVVLNINLSYQLASIMELKCTTQ